MPAPRGMHASRINQRHPSAGSSGHDERIKPPPPFSIKPGFNQRARAVRILRVQKPLFRGTALRRLKEDFNRKLFRTGKRNPRDEQSILHPVEHDDFGPLHLNDERLPFRDYNVTADLLYIVEPPSLISARHAADDDDGGQGKAQWSSHAWKLPASPRSSQLLLPPLPSDSPLSDLVMTLHEPEQIELSTPTGPMRTYVFRPSAPGRYPGLLLYSEIFQVTAPIRRTATLLAGHGFVVAVPEIYHEFEPAGTVLTYDQAGADRGNALKATKEISAYDADARAVLAFLKDHKQCTGRLGVMGICIGGHLAFRAAMNADVLAATCFYATDIHKRGLGKGANDNSLDRIPEIEGELLLIWGRQDPHVPLEGRLKIHAALEAAGRHFTWHEFNGAHAFLRDEGYRYDPELAVTCYGLALNLFRRKLGEGDIRSMDGGVARVEARH